MVMGPAQMAGGAPQMPSPAQTTQVAPGQAQVGASMDKIMQAIGMIVQQAVDKQGFVDMNRVISMWPQVAQQLGINIPFQTVWQLIQQNPNLLESIVVKYGLSGMIVNGQRISAEQMAGQVTGATGGGVG